MSALAPRRQMPTDVRTSVRIPGLVRVLELYGQKDRLLSRTFCCICRVAAAITPGDALPAALASRAGADAETRRPVLTAARSQIATNTNVAATGGVDGTMSITASSIPEAAASAVRASAARRGNGPPATNPPSTPADTRSGSASVIGPMVGALNERPWKWELASATSVAG